MKKMLFNATHAEELRVAIVEGQQLIDLDIESAVRSERKGNIYKAVITKVEPSLEACFVNYGAERHGFLPMKEIYRGYFQNYNSQTALNDIKINDVIKEGQELIVQVDKDERGTKGAALTTFISLAGRFLVLMPNNPKGGGISRRIVGEERNQLRSALDKLKLDKKHSLIARTAGIGRSVEELQWDLDFLTRLWETIEKASTLDKAPYLIYQEGNLVVRSIRDHLGGDINEIIIDNEEIYNRATRFVKQVMPHNLNKIKYYNDVIPLFTRYQVESQIDAAFKREVSLPSGGSIVIDHTEALISIDVNSARATKGGDIEETAFQTNLQAVEEVARQLRIRDMGGLVVIDLIDMSESNHQREVENRLKEALQSDRARVQIGQISRFGLLEMSRQRLRASISDANYNPCPRCDGTGNIRNVVSGSLSVLRVIEEEAQKENTEAIQVAVSMDMATYLFNEKRYELHQLESRLASRIIIVPTDDLESPQYTIRRLRSDEVDKISGVPSYKQKSSLIETKDASNELPESLVIAKPERSKIEVDDVMHETPPPKSQSKAKQSKAKSNKFNGKRPKSLVERLKALFFGSQPTQQEKKSKRTQKSSQERGNKNTNNNRGAKAQQSRQRANNRKNPKQQGKQQNKSQNRPHQKQESKVDSAHNTKQKKQTANDKQHKPKQNKPQQENTSKHTKDTQNKRGHDSKSPASTEQKYSSANATQNTPQNAANQNTTTKDPRNSNKDASNPSANEGKNDTRNSVNQNKPQGSQHNERVNTPYSQTEQGNPQREKGKLSRTISPAAPAAPSESSTHSGSTHNNPGQGQGQGRDKQEQNNKEEHTASDSAQPKEQNTNRQQYGNKRERSHLRNSRRRRSPTQRRNKPKVNDTEMHSNNPFPSDTNRSDYAFNKNFGKLPDDVGSKD